MGLSNEPVTLHGLLVDAPDGFVLSVRPDPDISEGFSNGAVLFSDTLQMVGPSHLTGRELEDLPRGRFYSHDRVAELMGPIIRDQVMQVAAIDEIAAFLREAMEAE